MIVKASKSDSPEVREAAIYVLTKHGDASSVAILLDAALAGGDVAAVAKDGLQTLPGKEVDEAIAAKLASADAKAKPILLELVGARQILAATPAVRQAMADADQAVRLAALAAMAQLVEVKDLDLLIDKALEQGGDAAEIAAAKAALTTAAQRMGDRDACAAKLAEHLRRAHHAPRPVLSARTAGQGERQDGPGRGGGRRQVARSGHQGRRHPRAGRMGEHRRRPRPAGNRQERPGKEVPDSGPAGLHPHRPAT